MAVQIKKRGTLKERRWAGDCKSCGCKAEAGQSDVKGITSDRDGELGHIKCPQCRAKMHVFPK